MSRPGRLHHRCPFFIVNGKGPPDPVHTPATPWKAMAARAPEASSRSPLRPLSGLVNDAHCTGAESSHLSREQSLVDPSANSRHACYLRTRDML